MKSEARSIADRRLALLQALDVRVDEAGTLTEAAARFEAVLGSSPDVLPFCAIYLLDAERAGAELAVAAGRDSRPSLPRSIPVAASDPWRFGVALAQEEPVLVDLEGGAAVLRLKEPFGTELLGCFVAGLGPGQAFDDGYRSWIRLVAAWLAAALGTSRASVAQQRQAAALQESEHRFARFMNHLPGLAWIKDHAGRYLFVNAAAERAFGRFHGAILGKTDAAIFPPATAAQFRKNDDRALAGGGAMEMVETLEHEDGVHHSLVSKFPIPAGLGGKTVIGGIAIDITERVRMEEALRESEARFRSMADNAPVLIWVNGIEGCEFVNSEYLRFLGCSWDEVRGMGWADFVHPEDRDAYVEAYFRAVEERGNFEAQVRFRHADGRYRWLHSTGVPRLTTDGSFVGYVGCSSDISELKLSEQALREADRHKDEFLATLAHELRSPLAPLRNALEVMRVAGEADTDELARARGIMERQLRQMVRLIDDLLDVSRISSGRLELRKERLTLSEVVGSALETTRPALEASGRELAVDLPAEPLLLEGDFTRLAQVVANLLHNAIKYTQAGGRIRLEARGEGGSIVVRVKDDGIGIPAEALSRVFEMFTQVDRSTGTSRGGLGVGLSIVRNLVAMHGGTVEALSEGPGRGAEFVVRLPALKAAAPALATPTEAPAIPAARRRILVVDDNQDSAECLALLLEMKGNDVRTASDGRAALAEAESFRPELIFLDIGMPGLDGHEVCRRIRTESWGRTLPIVALTGWSQEDDRRRSQQSGFSHHLVKPAEPSVLERLLADLSLPPHPVPPAG